MTERVLTLMVEVDQAELACRIYEAIVEHRRPEGMDAAAALAMQDEQSRRDVMRAAEAAMFYIAECVSRGQQPS